VVLRDYPEVERILIIDCDVHQGNGNAVLFAEDPRVTTFSMHCEGNFFSQRQCSDFDVELPVGCSDERYLGELEIWLPRVMAASRPHLIFFQAGVDPLANDKMGKCALSIEGLRARNDLVYAAALQAECKLVVTMGGGYPKNLSHDSRDFRQVVTAHTDVYLQAARAIRAGAAGAAAAGGRAGAAPIVEGVKRR
jgi:acetoin utilization deacetylase AcuC-like enzyme